MDLKHEVNSSRKYALDFNKRLHLKREVRCNREHET